MDEVQLQEQLKIAREERAQKCLDEIRAILEKYHCQILVHPQVIIDGQMAAVQVVAQ